MQGHYWHSCRARAKSAGGRAGFDV